MNHDSNTQGSRSWDDPHPRSQARPPGFRHSPRSSVPRNVSITAPIMNRSSPSSRSVSPGSTKCPRSPQQQQRVDPSPEDSANARWRSWRPPEDVAQSLSPAVSPRVKNLTGQALHEAPSSGTDYHIDPEGPPKSDTSSMRQDDEQHESIWNDDSWTDELDSGNDTTVPGDFMPTASNQTSNAIDNHDNVHYQRSGWTPEPSDDDEPTGNASPSPSPSPPPPRSQRSGWTPEPSDNDEPTGNASPSPSSPPPPPRSQPEKRILKLYIVNNRKEAQNVSIDDICVKVNTKKSEQREESYSPRPEPPTSATTGKNPSPFFAPEYFGNPSPDHYGQYSKNAGAGMQWQRRFSHGENNRTKRQANPVKNSVHVDDTNNNNSREVFRRYLDQEDIEKQISEGDLYKGVINISRTNRKVAYVAVEGLDSDVYVSGFRMINRAFDGDVVAVRLCDVDAVWNPKDQSAAAAAAAAAATSDFDFFFFEDDEVAEHTELIENDEPTKPKYAGEVVGILERPKERIFVGTIAVDQPSDGDDPNGLYKNKQKPSRFFLRPLDKKCPLIYIANRDVPSPIFTSPDAYKDTLLVAQVLNWNITKQKPSGKIIKTLGEVGDVTTETEAILTYCGISSSPYSSAAQKDVPKTPWRLPADEISRRRDYRAKRCFSIDPANAKDLDDILHIERLGDGTFEVGVHIADVSYFIKPNTALDTEARERGTSIYLVDRVLPMLPKTLCEDLCSLNPGQDRLAFSVLWKLDDEGNILDTWFGKTVIASSAKLTYEDAQRVIGGNRLPDTANIIDPKMTEEIERDILDLMGIARHLRKRRFANGALALGSVKLSFELDDKGDPIRVSQYQSKDANNLIEEFMLLANISVARKISSTYPNQAMLRRHPEPLLRRLDEFVKVAKKLGLLVDKSSAGKLQASLDAIPESPIKDAILVLATKPMQRAIYFCSGSLDVAQFIHYALNEAVYTHFTSPIRRYADIIVHRQLSNALDMKAESGFSKKTVESTAYMCNYRMEKAKAAEDQSSWLYLARYLTRTKDTAERRAMVVRVEPDFLDVYLHEFGLQRRLYVEDFPLEGSRYDVETGSLLLYWERGASVNLGMLMRREFRHSKKYRPRPRHDISDDCLQKIQAFSFIDVKTEVNNQRSPPRIIMYPVNPFEGD